VPEAGWASGIAGLLVLRQSCSLYLLRRDFDTVGAFSPCCVVALGCCWHRLGTMVVVCWAYGVAVALGACKRRWGGCDEGKGCGWRALAIVVAHHLGGFVATVVCRDFEMTRRNTSSGRRGLHGRVVGRTVGIARVR
jgi:hypothetical protein